MRNTRIEARHLKFGDVIAVDGVEGSWTVEAIFVEGKDGPIDIDLIRIGDPADLNAAYQYEWFVSQDHLVERLR